MLEAGLSLIHARREGDANDPPLETLRLELGKALYAAQTQRRQVEVLKEQLHQVSIANNCNSSPAATAMLNNSYNSHNTATKTPSQVDNAKLAAQHLAQETKSRLAVTEAAVSALQTQLAEAETRHHEVQNQVCNLDIGLNLAHHCGLNP